MAETNWKTLIKLLKKKNLNSKEYKLLETKCKKILQKALKSFYNHRIETYLYKLYGSDYLENIIQEFLIKLMNNLERFDLMEKISEKYLVTVAKNLILYQLSLNPLVVKEESLFDSPFSDEEENRIFETKEELSYTVNYLEDLVVEYTVKAIKTEFNEKELETICFYLHQIFCNEEISLSSRERNTLYKRWERLKPRLQALLSSDLEDTISTLRKIFEKIWSEICKKSDLKYIRDCL